MTSIADLNHLHMLYNYRLAVAGFHAMEGFQHRLKGSHHAGCRPPENANVLKVATRVAIRTAALIEGTEQSDHLEREQPGLSTLYGASLCGRIATGPNAGQRVKTTGDAIDGERDEVTGSRCAMVSGFSVHAGVGIRAGDRQRLEQLLRYAARPPVAIDRLAQLPDGRLTYRLKTPWRNGTTHVIFEASEFIEKLAALVPAPRANLVRYHGIFGPAAKWRPQIVPSPQKSEPADATCRDAYSVSRPRNYSWAELMRRVFEIEVLKCERCGCRRRIIAAIHPPDTTRRFSNVWVSRAGLHPLPVRHPNPYLKNCERP